MRQRLGRSGPSVADGVLDDIDLRILGLLARDGRISHAAIGGLVGLSGPAVYERVRKLEKSGAIRGYRAMIDPRVIGADLVAFINVGLEPGGDTPAAVLAVVRGQAEVLEAHHILGEDGLLLKVAVSGTAGLTACLERLRGIPGVASTQTRLVLSTAFERGPAVPMPLAESARSGRRKARSRPQGAGEGE